LKIAAPAKINLALHVTGQRADGYHLIETLVTFASVGDVISIESADTDRLTFSGSFGASLAAYFGTNLIIKATRGVRAHANNRQCPPVSIHLEKNLPIASGIGGGSADAAAALKGLNEFWELGLTEAELMRIGLTLGADVPMCVYGMPLIARGIGDVIEPVDGLPELPMLLVNPGVGVLTAEIFKGLTKKVGSRLLLPPLLQRGEGRVSGSGTRELADVPPSSGASRHLLPPSNVGRRKDPNFLAYLLTTRNDLEAAAGALCPAIGDVLTSLSDTGALFARMSGSGATCFGLYADRPSLETAKASIRKSHAGWWVA
jgi:4-diphosphocytidyl-2-C-methyl-D-erythritol kinase